MSETSAPPRIFSPEYYQRMRDLESDAWWNAGMRDVAAALLGRAKLPASGYMIDAGCGSGQTMSWFLASHPAWKSWGADVAMEGVKVAATYGLQVAQADVMRLPIRTVIADLIVSFDVIQHLPLESGDLQALTEFCRVLKPGGYLLLRTNSQSWPRTVDDPANNFRKYQPDRLERRLKEAGFEIDYLSRANSILGLAEVAREARATKQTGHGYHGLIADARKESNLARSLKRGVLRMEGAAIARRMQLPFGRSLVALCHKPLRDINKSNQTTT